MQYIGLLIWKKLMLIQKKMRGVTIRCGNNKLEEIIKPRFVIKLLQLSFFLNMSSVKHIVV